MNSPGRPEGSFLQRSRARRAGVLAVAAAGVAFPFLVQGYGLFQATQVLIYAMAILGLNLLAGYNGQISLGHGAFYAIGGYVTAILVTTAALPFWLAVPASALACFAVGYLIGLPALRLEPLYLALVTFSLAICVPQILKYDGLARWTGGVQGLMVEKPAAPALTHLSDDQWLYFLVLLAAVLLYLGVRNLVRDRIGRALLAIRDQPLAADTMGIDTRRYKTLTFGISAMCTGVAGGFAALATQFVSPESYGFLLSISLLVGAVVGGLTSTLGPLFGAAFIVFIPNVAEHVSKSAPWAVYGVFLIAFVYLMPEGVMGRVKQFGRRRPAR